MAIAQTTTTSFRVELLQAVHNFNSDTFKIALYTGAADIGPQTTVYGTSGEASGTGYTAGGVEVTGAVLNTQTTGPAAGTVYVNFDNVSWPGANFIARGALIYNTSQSNKSVAVLDFGSDKTFSSTSNTVTMPANTATTALIRFP